MTDGHILVIPNVHVADATEDPMVTAMVMECAALIASPPCNIITSAGLEATHSVSIFTPMCFRAVPATGWRCRGRWKVLPFGAGKVLRNLF